jgi:hypothetical protein
MTTNGITETRDPANSSCRGRAFYLPSRWTFRLHLTPSAASPWPTCATGAAVQIVTPDDENAPPLTLAVAHATPPRWSGFGKRNAAILPT